MAVFDYDQLIYQQGVEALQQSCLELHDKPFEKLEAGELPEEHWGDLDPLRFFKLLISHTMQGFYGPPRHGGNRNYMSYKMMGSAFGPDHRKNPRVSVAADGTRSVITPIKGGYGNNAACVGSGTVSYGAISTSNFCGPQNGIPGQSLSCLGGVLFPVYFSWYN